MINRYSLNHKKEYSLKVTSGTAWVTFENDMKDYIVDAGDDIVISKKSGFMLISNLSETSELGICVNELKSDFVLLVKKYC